MALDPVEADPTTTRTYMARTRKKIMVLLDRELTRAMGFAKVDFNQVKGLYAMAATLKYVDNRRPTRTKDGLADPTLVPNPVAGGTGGNGGGGHGGARPGAGRKKKNFIEEEEWQEQRYEM